MAPPDSPAVRLPAGTVLSHYRIEEPLGAGGMGVVYRATDLRLNRMVALKVIGHDAAEGETRRRFLKEARAASAFSHPNIVTIHEVDTAGDIDFIVMELVAGRSLAQRITGGVQSIDDVLAFGEQVASALAAADAAGIVHRDIKPANVMVSDSGHVRLLDFGIAKQLAMPGGADAATLTVLDPTVPGTVLGSVAYMSPEQAQGHAVDGRSDVFSFGVLLYELLAGRRPFGGTTAVETVAKILEATPPPLQAIRPDVPQQLAALVSACLEKDRNRRPQSSEVHAQLSSLRQSRSRSTTPLAAMLMRKAIAAPALILLVVAAGGGWWWWESGREVREARRRLPAILELASRGDADAFYREALRVMPLLPDEPRLKEAWTKSTFAMPMATTPPGAEIFVKGYLDPEDSWIPMGQTPREVRFPVGFPRMKIVKEGYVTYDGTLTLGTTKLVLDPIGSVPDGMVRVIGARTVVEGNASDVPDFWMNRFEVTNREFKTFVDAGGYSKREYWKEAFIDQGRTLPWEDAMARMRDQTGRPGPASWELGTHPSGQAEYPVGGVSWYEAAAYAVFAGRTLPTAYQWRTAADFAGPSGVYGAILLRSNFNGKGPAPVGQLMGIGPFGQQDQAGNVKEWCWNESRGGRMIFGGGWTEPKYMYEDKDAQAPFTRLPTYGFRLVKNIAPPPEASYAFLVTLSRDYSVEKPIDDAAFAMARRIYAYDKTPLNSKLESSDDAVDWRHEVVTFDAAYGGERIIAHVFLPKAAAPPYQTVVYFPGGEATITQSSKDLNLTNVDFLIRGGRALVYPVYKGTFERAVSVSGLNAGRDLVVQRVKDLQRAVDYIATRQDLDSARLGYYGVSLGAYHAAIITAVETRLKASVLLGGGLGRTRPSPETDPLNFAPRVRVPTLMVNGTNDFQFPRELTQLPLLRLLNLPPDQKRHAQFDGGHMPLQIHEVMREILDWFDKFLGPVKTAANNRTN